MKVLFAYFFPNLKNKKKQDSFIKFKSKLCVHWINFWTHVCPIDHELPGSIYRWTEFRELLE